MNSNPLERQVSGCHYSMQPIQPVEYATANGFGYCESLALRYITRHRRKGGAEDLHKAIHCLQMLIELEYTSKQQPAAKREPTELDKPFNPDKPVAQPPTLLHVFREAFDRHELTTERHTIGDLIDSLHFDSNPAAICEVNKYLFAEPTLTRSTKLGPFFSFIAEGPECTSCGG